MSLSSGQLANSLQASAQAVPIFKLRAQHKACNNCSHQLLSQARYCGECGSAVLGEETQSEPIHRAPSFAEVHIHQVNEAPKELRDELDKLFAFLTRERFFLCCHYLTYIAVNLFGFSLALKAYNEYIGDEATKLVVALGPFSVFNLLAFLSFPQIKGTRKEIARLKERLTYVRYQIEYWGLI
jgi:hypothetical protein